MSERRATRQRRREVFEAAAEIIRFEYGEELTLDGVAQRVYTSRRQLQRAFSEAAQTRFRDYLTRVRMERARELLCGSSHCVREIARAVGYQEPAQFAKAFRRTFGLSPSAVRGQRSDDAPCALEQTEREPLLVVRARRT
jgi:AraC family transcriptional regulator, regulatory protein of adaptative response / methylphosphotriester-DNA alkyltransferase methyltransferase